MNDSEKTQTFSVIIDFGWVHLDVDVGEGEPFANAEELARAIFQRNLVLEITNMDDREIGTADSAEARELRIDNKEILDEDDIKALGKTES